MQVRIHMDRGDSHSHGANLDSDDHTRSQADETESLEHLEDSPNEMPRHGATGVGKRSGGKLERCGWLTLRPAVVPTDNLPPFFLLSLDCVNSYRCHRAFQSQVSQMTQFDRTSDLDVPLFPKHVSLTRSARQPSRCVSRRLSPSSLPWLWPRSRSLSPIACRDGSTRSSPSCQQQPQLPRLRSWRRRSPRRASPRLPSRTGSPSSLRVPSLRTG